MFETVGDEEGFLGAWRAIRSRDGATLLRSHSPQAEFRFVEIAPDTAPPPELPARAHTAVYAPVVDDLHVEITHDCVWVNPYEVEPEHDAAFIAGWTATRDTVRGRPGYIGSRLHRALDPGARFRFVNVAPWGDLDTVTAAVATTAFAESATAIYHQAHPSLYAVLRG